MRHLRPFVLLSLLALMTTPASAADLEYIDSDPETGSSRAVVMPRGANLAHTTQVFPLDSRGRLVGEGDFAAQFRQTLQNVAAALQAAGSDRNQIARLNVYVTEDDLVAAVQSELAREFTGEARPAVTFVTTPLPHSGAMLAMDAIAVAPAPRERQQAVRLQTERLSSPAVQAHIAVAPGARIAYISGQASRGTLAEATRETMESLHRTLEFLGIGPAQVLQVKTFVQPMSDVATAEAEIRKFYADGLTPPLTHVEWRSRNAIEIELIAALPGPAPAAADTIWHLTPPGMTASPVFSRVAVVDGGRQIFTSGLIARDAVGHEDQIHDVFGQLKQLAEAAGSSLRHCAKATYYTTNDEIVRPFGAVRQEYYDPARPPAASRATVGGIGPPDRHLAIDMILTTTE